MIYIPNHSMDCYFNLALEEYVFTSFDPSQSYLLLWRNDNTIVVGKHQNTTEEINADYVNAHGIHVVRRMSGGGAVYHDLGNLNFTFITHQASNGAFDFRAFTLPIVRALSAMGVTAAFNSRNDLTVDGKKFSGNAQYVRSGRVLHHGTLLFDSNLNVLSDALRVRESKCTSHGVKSTRARVTNLIPYLPPSMTIEAFQVSLLHHLFPQGIVSHLLTEEEQSAVYKLRDEKYATWDWNYGASPPYTIRREAHFPGGLVTIYLGVKEGKIQSVRFYGDFFGAEQLEPLEQELVGTPLREDALRAAFSHLHISEYFSQIHEGELMSLFL